MIDLRRYSLGVVAMVAMLAGCSGHGSNGVVPSGVPGSLSNQKTFNYSGAKQDFKVPAGVTHITVVALGAHGAGSPEAYGGRVYAVVPVTPGETLVVYVGGNASEVTGGFNGGGKGGDKSGFGSDGNGGGGASDIREGGLKLSDRVLVAGGGGGDGGGGDYSSGGPGLGGGGGGKRAGSGGGGGGSSRDGDGGGGGGGGAQHAGGAGGSGGSGVTGFGTAGRPGSVRHGGRGAAMCQGLGGGDCGYSGGGGGGGGGYYGGGGGGSGGGSYSLGGSGGGGGGGSSYAESSATNVRFWQGWKKSAHNGLVVFSW
jgi:hypothetical protein